MTVLLTFLFTDIEGSSRLWDQQAESMRRAHRQHNEILRRIIDEHGGSVVKDRGDGFMAAFGDPSRALIAAAEGQRELSNADWSDLGEDVRVRMGIHTGPAEEREGDYFGSDVNIAARLEGLAHGGQILMSDATHALTVRSLPESLHTRDLGHHRLKGIGKPERVHQLVVDGLLSEFPSLDGGSIGQSLPRYPGNLYGRDADLEAVVAMCREGSRLITLLGPGGIGKTRLAVEAARQMSDGNGVDAYFADMAPIRVPSEIGPTFAAAVGVHVEGTVDPFDLVADRIAEPTVTVMDNLEHLTGVGPSISRLLEASPVMTVIATSRSPLRIRDEKVFPVAPLSIGTNGASAAVDLFYERAAAQGIDLSQDDRPMVRSLCERVDGLPLAIELVAAQTRLLSIAELDAMLAESLDALGTAGDDRPDRHRTIRDTIEWSLSGLTDRQRELFSQLAVFPAGPTLDQLAFVRDEPPGSILDDLGALADNSLVSPATGLAGGTRFRQLALLREYGIELAAASGEADRVMSGLVDYYVDRAASMQTGLMSDNRTTRELANDHANLVAAMQWSLDHERAEDMAGFLADIWIYWFNGDRTETAAEFVRGADELTSGPKLDWLAGFILGFQLGDFEAAAVRMSRAERGFAELGDDYWVAMSRLWLGTTSTDVVAARLLLESAYEELSAYEQHPAIRPLALLFLSMADMRAGAFDQALERRRAAFDRAVAVGHPELIAWMPWNIAATLLFMGRHGEARSGLAPAFEFMADDAYQEGIASFGHIAGVIAIREGEMETGLTLIGASDAVMERIGVAVWGELDMLRTEAVEAAHGALGDAAAARILARGRHLSLTDLIDMTRATLATP